MADQATRLSSPVVRLSPLSRGLRNGLCLSYVNFKCLYVLFVSSKLADVVVGSMWVLCVPDSPEISLLPHERWLRPGSTLSIGRNHSNDVIMEGAKSISKQHLTICVAATYKGASTKLDVRSVLTIRDLGSKFKTFISHSDEAELEVDTEYNVTVAEIFIRLGKVKHALFKICWRPFVLTLSNVKAKEVQNSCDQLDIKFSKDYTDLTTHVVTGKYNTPKTLQALTRQKWIVGQKYVEAMLAMADEMTKNMNSLPDPTVSDYLPPEDAFSLEYGRKAFLPTAGRENSFEGLEFVFFDRNQYVSLSPPIIAGEGKAFLYEGTLDMNGIAYYLTTLNRPVIVLTIEEETTAMLDDLVPLIGAVSLTQGDFIRVLLSNGVHEIFAAKKTKLLSLPPVELPPRVSTSQIGFPSERAASTQANESLQTQPSESTALISKRIGSRPMKVLPNFDDDLFGGNMDYAPKRRVIKDALTQAQSQKPTSSSRSLLDSDEIFGSSAASSQMPTKYPRGAEVPLASGHSSSQAVGTQLELRGKRSYDGMSDPHEPAFKRSKTQSSPVVGSEEETEEAFELAPAAAEYARKRSQVVASQDLAQSTHANTRLVSKGKEADQTALRRKQKQREITEKEIEDTLKENKRRAEQQKQTEEEENSLPLNGELKNLGTVEFFKVTLPDPRSTSQSSGDRNLGNWDPKWNGRKNFKGFRRAAKNGNIQAQDRPAIMIRLVPSEPSDRGLADQQWLETATTRNQGDVGLKRSRNDEVATNREFGTIHVLDINGKRSETSGISESRFAASQTRMAPNEEHTSGLRRPPHGGASSTARHVPARKPQSNAGSAQRGSRQERLFMPDDSDSDDDPLRFRL